MAIGEAIGIDLLATATTGTDDGEGLVVVEGSLGDDKGDVKEGVGELIGGLGESGDL